MENYGGRNQTMRQMLLSLLLVVVVTVIAVAVTIGSTYASSDYSRRISANSQEIQTTIIPLVRNQTFNSNMTNERAVEYVEHFINNTRGYFNNRVQNNHLVFGRGSSGIGHDGTSRFPGGITLVRASGGCHHYATFIQSAMYGIRGSDLYLVRNDRDRQNFTAQDARTFFQRYGQAGELLRFCNTHSWVFIAAGDTGFYTLQWHDGTLNRPGVIETREPFLSFWTYEAFANRVRSAGRNVWLQNADTAINTPAQGGGGGEVQSPQRDFRNDVSGWRAITSNQQRFIRPANANENFARIRSGPYERYSEVRRVNTGTQITVVGFGTNSTRSQNRWYRVSNPVSGWIYSGNISTTAPPTHDNNNQNITTITTSVSPANSGSVQVVSGTLTGASGRNVRLQANPASGWRFTGWYIGGSRISTNNPQDFHARENRRIEARFMQQQVPPQTTITTSVSPDNSGSVQVVSGTLTGDPGRNVRLQANPASGWRFSGWYVNGVRTSTHNPQDWHARENRRIEARFVQQVQPQTTITTSVSPANGGSVQVVSGTLTGDPGRNVRLQANPASGWRFSGWYVNGVWTSTHNPQDWHAREHRRIEARFVQTTPPPVQHNVTVRANTTSGITHETLFRFTANTNFDATRVVIHFRSACNQIWEFNMNRTNSREWFLNTYFIVPGTSTVTVHAYEGNTRRASSSMQASSQPRN